MNDIRHVLVASDGGPLAVRVADAAAEFAAPLGARVTLLHVIPPFSASGGPEIPPDLRGAAAGRDLARGALEAAVEHLRRVVPSVCGAVRQGSPTEEIVNAAAELGADVVVVGTHGRRGVTRALLGSVAEVVVRKSPVPVLCVHPWWFETRADAGRALARRLGACSERAGAVIALSRNGVPVGAELRRALGATLDLLVTRPLEHRGAVAGGTSEGGAVRLAKDLPASVRRAALASAGAAAEELREYGARLRGGACMRPPREVLLLSDVLVEPWTTLAAAEVVTGRGAARLVAVAPIATRWALEIVRAEIPAIALHTVEEADAASVYATDGEVPDRVVAASLRA